MTDAYKAPNDELIAKIKEELKTRKDIMAPAWADFVKTGAHKERPPVEKDWWYTRVASVFIIVGKLGPVGVGKLRIKYGGKRRRGHKPPRFYKGSGNIIRKCLQQLEAAGLLQKKDTGVHKGRILSKEGTSLLNKIAIDLYKKSKSKLAKKEEVVVKKEVPKQEKKEEKKEPVKEEKVKDKKPAEKKEEKKEPVKEEKKPEEKKEEKVEKKEEKKVAEKTPKK